jgi:hypothetical protein
MTWGDWVESSYNTLGLITYTDYAGCYIMKPDDDYAIYNEGIPNYTFADCSEQIIENGTYSANHTVE